MPWADVTEFTHYLQASGLYGLNPTAAQQLLDLQGALDAAVEEWEDMTHYWPFLSTGNVNETRYYDPPCSRLLDFNSGVLTFTSLTTDLVYEAGGTNSLSTGVSRTNYQDLRLKPSDAPGRGEPYTYAELGWTCGGGPGSVALTAEFGYCTDANLPKSARRAVMALAAQELLPQILSQISGGGLTQLQRGDEMKRWDFTKMQEVWNGHIADAMRGGQYVRPRLA